MFLSSLYIYILLLMKCVIFPFSSVLSLLSVCTHLSFYAGMELWRSSGGNRLAVEAMYGFNRNVDKSFGTTNCNRFNGLTMNRPVLFSLPSLVQPLPL
jgi:hypothetical protein